eukprot:TRINITY_DN20420_c0_g1_i1.p1 TRINITY_DN20420_c0_g1~~TRINITY_DN20420_c0_g1_i1.p1  ORF type:complete len:430 (-),score=101.42 TRINITY_DN20420_c0_g1_i1:314-1603(-)
MLRSLVGSEMCIRDSINAEYGEHQPMSDEEEWVVLDEAAEPAQPPPPPPAQLPLPLLVPYGVLGESMLSGGWREQRAPEPSGPGRDVAFVDPAGLAYIQGGGGPRQAGGASGAIYEFLGIGDHDAFHPEVVDAVKKDGDAKLHTYGDKHCIHVVGPNFNDKWNSEQSYEWAVNALAEAYRNVLAEFSGSGEATLRLLPISGSIFAGKWRDRVPQLTADAWLSGSGQLAESARSVLCGRRLEMCIYNEEDLALFLSVFGVGHADETNCTRTAPLVVTLSHTQQEMMVRITGVTTVHDVRQQVAARSELQPNEIQLELAKKQGAALHDTARCFSLGMYEGGAMVANVNEEAVMVRRMKEQEEMMRHQTAFEKEAFGGGAFQAEGDFGAATSGDNQQGVADLEGMGFAHEQATWALEMTDGNVEQALTLLLS